MNQENTAPELRKKLVSADELASSFDPPVSRSAVYFWRAQDIIRPARKEGRVALYDLEECLQALGDRKGRSTAVVKAFGQISAKAVNPKPRSPGVSRSNNVEPLYAGSKEVERLKAFTPPAADADEVMLPPENLIHQNFPDSFREIAAALKPAAEVALATDTRLQAQPEPIRAAARAEPERRDRDHSRHFLNLLARRAKDHQERGELEAENALLWALVEAGGFGGAL